MSSVVTFPRSDVALVAMRSVICSHSPQVRYGLGGQCRVRGLGRFHCCVVLFYLVLVHVERLDEQGTGAPGMFKSKKDENGSLSSDLDVVSKSRLEAF